jgi:hypothetical protein
VQKHTLTLLPPFFRVLTSIKKFSLQIIEDG